MTDDVVTDEAAPSAAQDPHWTRSVAVTGSNALAVTPAPGAGRLAQFLYDRRDQAVWIYVAIAVAVVVAAGGALAWAYAYCVDRGGSFDGGLSADWGNFTVDLQFKCTQ